MHRQALAANTLVPGLAWLVALTACVRAAPVKPASASARPACSLDASPHPDAVSVAAALGVTDGLALQMRGYILMHAPPCPPCPPGYKCEACLPPFEMLGDELSSNPAGGATAWVDVGKLACDVAALPLGVRAVVTGEWKTTLGPGALRVLDTQLLVRVP